MDEQIKEAPSYSSVQDESTKKNDKSNRSEMGTFFCCSQAVAAVDEGRPSQD